VISKSSENPAFRHSKAYSMTKSTFTINISIKYKEQTPLWRGKGDGGNAGMRARRRSVQGDSGGEGVEEGSGTDAARKGQGHWHHRSAQGPALRRGAHAGTAHGQGARWGPLNPREKETDPLLRLGRGRWLWQHERKRCTRVSCSWINAVLPGT
jgi:hypothetical protein